jgi:hypothetical protein
MGWRNLTMSNDMSNANVEYDKTAYECYRTNHFEVIPIIRDDNGEEKVLDSLRLAVEKATLDKLSGKLSLYVYATRQVVDYINTIDENTDIKNRTYRFKYVLYSDDSSHKVTILNHVMTLTDISFEMFCSRSDAAMIRLDYIYS